MGTTDRFLYYEQACRLKIANWLDIFLLITPGLPSTSFQAGFRLIRHSD